MVWGIGIWYRGFGICCEVSAYGVGYQHMVWGIGICCGVSA